MSVGFPAQEASQHCSNRFAGFLSPAYATSVEKLLWGPVMVKDAFDRWWEWVDKPAESTLTISSHIHDVVMETLPERHRDRTAVNEAVRLADPDGQR